MGRNQLTPNLCLALLPTLSQGLFPLWAESTRESKYFPCLSGWLCWWGPGFQGA